MLLKIGTMLAMHISFKILNFCTYCIMYICIKHKWYYGSSAYVYVLKLAWSLEGNRSPFNMVLIIAPA